MQHPTTGEPEVVSQSPILADGRGYLLAVVCVGLAWLLRWALDPLLLGRLPYGFFFLAVIVVTQFAGIRPTALAAIGGFLVGDRFFVGQRLYWLPHEPLSQVSGVIYFGVCLAVLLFSLRMRRSLAQERAARAALIRLAAEREELVEELQKALSEVKTLSGLFPICSYCKKIRDDKGYWNKLEQYLHQHSGADFTHSICPDCAKRHYGEFYTSETSLTAKAAP